jgi:hypothetical protein
MDHEHWSMICNVAIPVHPSKIFKTLDAFKLLIEAQVLSD